MLKSFIVLGLPSQKTEEIEQFQKEAEVNGKLVKMFLEED
jgi:hypothetical protein